VAGSALPATFCEHRKEHNRVRARPCFWLPSTAGCSVATLFV
jgi:hypothetical protein